MFSVFSAPVSFPDCNVTSFILNNQSEGVASMSCRYANAKYMTIAEQITRRIRSGEFLTKEPFYSRDELARAYNISPGTARAVVRVLEDRGIIACRKGKRPVPADVIADLDTIPVCKPVFLRDAFTAETPEYDYLTYCVRNILMRRKIVLREQDYDSDMPGFKDQAEYSAGDVAVVIPSPSTEKAVPLYPAIGPSTARIDLVIDQTECNAVSVFTQKAGLDCVLHLIRHNIASAVHITSRHSAFPWFGGIFSPGKLQEYIPNCKLSSLVFDNELELFPAFLPESVPATPDHAPVAILIDDPYLSDYLSGEIRAGAYSPPSWCSFFGTALNERSMVFPYLDLKLDELAVSLLKAASSKAENPAADLACDFHLLQFRNPGPV